MSMPRLRWVQHLPIASCILMLLLGVFWVTGIGEYLVLSPTLLTSPLQAFRLVTYCLAHANGPLLAASLFFFPLLSWHLELHQGVLGYLRSSTVSAVLTALVYVFLAKPWGAEPQATVSGYLPVHLALLGCHGKRSAGWPSVALLAGLLFGLGEILSPRSPFLLNVSGLLTGVLAYCTGSLSKRRLARLRKRIPGWSHLRRAFAHSIRPFVSTTDEQERIPAQKILPPDLAGMVAIQIPPPPPSWSDERAAQESQLPFPPTSQRPFSDPGEALASPYFSLPDFPTEEELLQAGIRASLQDRNEEVKLLKSSVSSLRLQQLQKMGFATEEAVIALAATGHVEGAVSLLIGGHVGDQAVVMAETRSAPPQSIPNP
ncbi:rhomboid domain-containing protein 3 isoform X2 [Thamnophis elegans]|nr:rhomboid domain-containing protein 3 isoform X2 [Thamnophis elegans]XP_032085554.1 rhomboid domain-containing protein 3 isoform X2 [Thamnophis elegans]XP_032085555.1 rhomboid domain-containing protein 3 isoform X2 [Thamnophis elegans]